MAQDPHCCWFFTGVTALLLQSTDFGKVELLTLCMPPLGMLPQTDSDSDGNLMPSLLILNSSMDMSENSLSPSLYE